MAKSEENIGGEGQKLKKKKKSGVIHVTIAMEF